MANQTILFTVMPRGIALNSSTLPVSVYVSPRLMGEKRLRAFPDWLSWTRRLREEGLSLTLRSGTRQTTVKVATEPLRPDLWEAMFNERTFVRSHEFVDYSGRAIFSYPVRYALSTIKAIYQIAGVELALPDPDRVKGSNQEESRPQQLLRALLAGLEVNWSDQLGDRLRKKYRDQRAAASVSSVLQLQATDLGPDGLLALMPPPEAEPSLRRQMTEQFAVFSHIPTGPPIADNPPDFDTTIDFHQALSSLNSYPALLRALGLVFDFELPKDFLRLSGTQLGAISVVDLPNVRWRLQATSTVPALPPLETAYVLVENAAHTTSIFATAPGVLGQLSTEFDTFGLLNVSPVHYGLAQVDVDSALHKAVMLAETWQTGQAHPASADHPDVFDSSATLPSLRSGGLSLFADGRALKLLTTFQQSKTFNDALASKKPADRPFFAEDLIHGYRLDIWDSSTGKWHSLHERSARYRIGDRTFDVKAEEGFSQLAAAQAPPNPETPPADDLYLHESVARWAGWSLSVPMVGRHLSPEGDPDKALDQVQENEPATPFKMTTDFTVTKGSLPSLRFGRSYRLRARVVDICGNSLHVDDPLADVLAQFGFALPADAEGFPYLRYEPVAAPLVIVRDGAAITGPGSTVDRLVIRTFNSDPSLDGVAADLTASDRHLVPPRTSVEVGERLSMFDDGAGKLVSSAAMYSLIADRDKGELPQVEMEIAGHPQTFPLEAADAIGPLPYLPDVLSRGAALRNLPGTDEATIGRTTAPDGPGSVLEFSTLDDPNPRQGSATLIGFAGADDWQQMQSIRLALAEAGGGHIAPEWDGSGRVLTVFLPKGTQSVVPLSSFMTPDDLKLMGVWQWVREYINLRTLLPDGSFLRPGQDVDRIAHVLQRAVEGGHWMITPPRLLTLVHAVQQPMGVPAFTAISVQHAPYGDPTKFPFDETRDPSPTVLQTEPERAPTGDTELAPVTAWRKPGAVDAFLMGGLYVHGASTEKIDLFAEWSDPIDDVGTDRVEVAPGAADPNREARSAHVDEVPLRTLGEGIISVHTSGLNSRSVGFYDANHDLLCFVRNGDSLGNLKSADPAFQQTIFTDAAPRHHLNDTKHHRITYTAVATSRFQDCFPQNQEGGFTRTSAPIVVDVPASTRPNAPQIAFVVPTFGWQRQTETNLKRSVRFGGGLRVYLDRPWFSSGDDELLGVSLYSFDNGFTIDRKAWKNYATQWGADPIWTTNPLVLSVPGLSHFPDAVASEQGISLEAPAPGRVDIVGYPVHFDAERQMWYADLTINTDTLTYCPFVRLALVRYQPHALPDAKASRVVLADFAQLTPSRAAVITADPYHPRRLRVTVSGIAPSGPTPVIVGPQPTNPVGEPTVVTVTVQQRDDAVGGELGWKDVAAGTATITEQTSLVPSDLVRWTGLVDFAQPVEAGRFRLLIQENEYLSANHVETEPAVRGATPRRFNPGRLIYAETVAVDTALVGGPSAPTGTVVEG